MLTTTFIRENLELAKAGLRKRNSSQEILDSMELVLAKDDQRKATQTELDQSLSDQKKLAAEIGQLFKTGRQDEAQSIKDQVATKKEKSKALESDLKSIVLAIENLLLDIPNIPNEKVPAGTSEEDNEIYKPFEGVLPDLGDTSKPHWDLASEYKLIDFKLGAKISGSGFPVYTGKGARLERALINYFLDEASKAGYLEVVPPLLVNEDSARGTGQLPDKEGQMYHCTKDNLFLIPTAEVPLTNMYRDAMLKESDFPIKLTGYTPCFRREAGSYGSDVKGLNRLHQFNKIEIVQIQHPSKSDDTLYEMINHVSSLLDNLELPYRILRLCSGDLSFASSLTYDFEVFSAAQKKWLEVSSVSNFETFQSNRLKLRFKNEAGKSTLAHTLNGSALALARIVAALLENNQTSEGIKIPEVLRPYTGFDIIS